jgi:TPR repeat protein
MDFSCAQLLAGEGAPVDLDGAIHWVGLAAEQGDARAIHTLEMYRERRKREMVDARRARDPESHPPASLHNHGDSEL